MQYDFGVTLVSNLKAECARAHLTGEPKSPDQKVPELLADDMRGMLPELWRRPRSSAGSALLAPRSCNRSKTCAVCRKHKA